MMLANLFSDLAGGVISRTTGPLKFRFLLQPLMAIFLAIRSGLRDSRNHKPPYFWEFCEDPAMRKELMVDCWKSVGKVFILALVLDCIYQLIELPRIYVFDALMVAFLLAIIPYVLIRGPVNRIATFRQARQPLPPAQSEQPAPVKKAV
jgi:hypothetical protein